MRWGIFWAILLGIGFLAFYFIFLVQDTDSCKQIDKNITSDHLKAFTVALAFTGARLVGTNMRLIVLRIGKTEEQIEAHRNSHLLNKLHQGLDMLYSDGFSKQKGGVEYLHNFAKANKDKRAQVLEIFRVFVREIPLKEKEEKGLIKGKHLKEKDPVKGKHPGRILMIKQEILYKLFPPKREESIYSVEKINLEGAQLKHTFLPKEKVALHGCKLQNVNLQYANLRHTDLRNADLTGADLRHANLQRCNLENADVKNAILDGVDLRGVDLRSTNFWEGLNEPWMHASHPPKLDYVIMNWIDPFTYRYDGEFESALSTLDTGIIWVKEDTSKFWYKDQKGINKEKLTEALFKETDRFIGEEEYYKEEIGIICGVANYIKKEFHDDT